MKFFNAFKGVIKDATSVESFDGVEKGSLAEMLKSKTIAVYNSDDEHLFYITRQFQWKKEVDTLIIDVAYDQFELLEAYDRYIGLSSDTDHSVQMYPVFDGTKITMYESPEKLYNLVYTLDLKFKTHIESSDRFNINADDTIDKIVACPIILTESNSALRFVIDLGELASNVKNRLSIENNNYSNTDIYGIQVLETEDGTLAIDVELVVNDVRYINITSPDSHATEIGIRTPAIIEPDSDGELTIRYLFTGELLTDMILEGQSALMSKHNAGQLNEYQPPKSDETSDYSEEPLVDERAEDLSEELVEEVSEDVSEAVSEDVSEAVSEDVSEEVPEAISEELVEEVPEEVSEDVSEEVSEDVSEEVSEDNEVEHE